MSGGRLVAASLSGGRRFALLTCLLALTAACATPAPLHVGLPPEARAAIASTEVITLIPQDGIYIHVPPTEAITPGLITMLVESAVDASRNAAATEAAAPLRAAMTGYSFDETLRAALASALTGGTSLRPNGFRTLRDTADLPAQIAASPGDAVLVVRADYRLSNDAAQLEVTVTADLYPGAAAALRALRPRPNDGAAVDPGNALYRNIFINRAQAPAGGADRAARIAAWAADDALALRAALDQAAAELARALAAELR